VVSALLIHQTATPTLPNYPNLEHSSSKPLSKTNSVPVPAKAEVEE